MASRRCLVALFAGMHSDGFAVRRMREPGLLLKRPACSTGQLLVSAWAAASSQTVTLQKSDYPGANALREWTDVMNPHAKLQRQQLLEQAERRKSRHLLQV